jgi:DNA-binding HxlR family transcriptional regulator
MQGESNGRKPGGDVWMVERAVVLQILRDDHEEHWPHGELAQEIAGCAPAVLDEALAHLERDGVLLRDGEAVCAARPVRRLDELELIGV